MLVNNSDWLYTHLGNAPVSYLSAAAFASASFAWVSLTYPAIFVSVSAFSKCPTAVFGYSAGCDCNLRRYADTDLSQPHREHRPPVNS